jgi:internalin A
LFFCAELNLSHNKITTLPEQLSDLSHLRVLNMAHNNLPITPSVTAKMPALEELDLSYNRIDSKY